jgi:flagellar motor switch protein FliN/FliY
MTTEQQSATGTGTSPLGSPQAVQAALERLASSLGEGSGEQGRVAEVLTRVADFLQLNPTMPRGAGMSLDFLLDVPVSVQAELGHTTMPIEEILKLEPGSVVELHREVSQPIDLLVAGVLFARGEVVVVDDRFAVRIKELVSPRARKGVR